MRQEMRRDQQAGERGGSEAAVGRGPPARLVRGGLLEIELHGAGLDRAARAEGVVTGNALKRTALGCALRGEFGSVTQYRPAHRLARPARISGRRASIQLVDVIVLVRRSFVHASSCNTSRSLARA
jgi:hypothetical protein